MFFNRKHAILLALVVGAFASSVGAQQRPDPCSTDLSIPLEAYLCSERKLAASKKLLAKELAATVAVLPGQVTTTSSVIVTKRELQEAQAAWAMHVKKHCALVTKFPGEAADWHFPVANENFCHVAELEGRISYLRKWRTCATEGGGVCLP